MTEQGPPGETGQERSDGPPPPKAVVDPTAVPPIDSDATKQVIEKTIEDTRKAEYGYAKLGLISGLIVVGIGVVLLLLGASAAVDFTLSIPGTKIVFKTAAIGLVVAVIGVLIILFTRPLFYVRRGKASKA